MSKKGWCPKFFIPSRRQLFLTRSLIYNKLTLKFNFGPNGNLETLQPN